MTLGYQIGKRKDDARRLIEHALANVTGDKRTPAGELLTRTHIRQLMRAATSRLLDAHSLSLTRDRQTANSC